MKRELKNKLKAGKKMSSAVAKKQSFENSPHDLSKNLKIISLPNNTEEELCYSLDKSLFQLEKDLVFFNFALKEIKEIIKFS